MKQCHTEARRGRRIIKTKQWESRRHRRCIERRSLFANSISNLYTKNLSQNSYQESVCYTSVALCTVGTSVTLHYLRPLRDSVCLIYKSFSLSLQISEEPFFYLFLFSYQLKLPLGSPFFYIPSVCNHWINTLGKYSVRSMTFKSLSIFVHLKRAHRATLSCMALPSARGYYNQNTKKSYYNSAKNIPKRMTKNKHFSSLCNLLVISNLHYSIAKHAYLDSKRALVRTQKSIFCKLIRRLLEAKRPYIGFEGYEKICQISK